MSIVPGIIFISVLCIGICIVIFALKRNIKCTKCKSNNVKLIKTDYSNDSIEKQNASRYKFRQYQEEYQCNKCGSIFTIIKIQKKTKQFTFK